jgi:hypothetical protein
MNKLVKGIDKNNLYYEYLKSLNGILNLTDRELTIMVKLMEYDAELDKTPDVSKNVVDASHRKRIKDEIGTTPDNLSRYIKKFKETGLLVQGKADDEVYVNRILMPEIIKDRVQITIILRLNEEN